MTCWNGIVHVPHRKSRALALFESNPPAPHPLQLALSPLQPSCREIPCVDASTEVLCAKDISDIAAAAAATDSVHVQPVSSAECNGCPLDLRAKSVAFIRARFEALDRGSIADRRFMSCVAHNSATGPVLVFSKYFAEARLQLFRGCN